MPLWIRTIPHLLESRPPSDSFVRATIANDHHMCHRMPVSDRWAQYLNTICVYDACAMSTVDMYHHHDDNCGTQTLSINGPSRSPSLRRISMVDELPAPNRYEKRMVKSAEKESWGLGSHDFDPRLNKHLFLSISLYGYSLLVILHFLVAARCRCFHLRQICLCSLGPCRNMNGEWSSQRRAVDWLKSKSIFFVCVFTQNHSAAAAAAAKDVNRIV